MHKHLILLHLVKWPLTLPSPQWGGGRVNGAHVKEINAFVLVQCISPKDRNAFFGEVARYKRVNSESGIMHYLAD